MKIIVYPDFAESQLTLGKKLLNEGYKFVKVSSRIFPNREVLARIESIDKLKNADRIYLFFPTYPDTNNRIILLLQTLEIIGNYGGSSISLIIPYLSYSRQDKRFREGESLSLKLILDLMFMMGVEEIISFDVHNSDAFREFFPGKALSISLLDKLVSRILEIHKLSRDEVILIAPDEGRRKIVESIARKYSIDSTYMIKERDLETGEIKMEFGSGVFKRYKYGILIDDEISTGGTMSMAANFLRNKVEFSIATATHLLLVGDADNRLKRNGITFIYGSNTIENPYVLLDIWEVLKDIIES